MHIFGITMLLLSFYVVITTIRTLFPHQETPFRLRLSSDSISMSFQPHSPSDSDGTIKRIRRKIPSTVRGVTEASGLVDSASLFRPCDQLAC